MPSSKLCAPSAVAGPRPASNARWAGTCSRRPLVHGAPSLRRKARRMQARAWRSAAMSRRYGECCTRSVAALLRGSVAAVLIEQGFDLARQAPPCGGGGRLASMRAPSSSLSMAPSPLLSILREQLRRIGLSADWLHRFAPEDISCDRSAANSDFAPSSSDLLMAPSPLESSDFTSRTVHLGSAAARGGGEAQKVLELN